MADAAPPEGFANIHRHGFVRAAVAAPEVAIADPAANRAAIAAMAARAHDAHASILLTPELSLSGYTLDDLFHQTALLDAVETEFAALAAETAGLRPLILVGLPVAHDGRLYNCAAALHGGRLLGLVPKTYLPNYREFYERRHFASGADPARGEIAFAGQTTPFGTDLLFAAEDVGDLVIGVEICEDLWVPHPPSSFAATAGATVIANLSASNATIGKSATRHVLAEAQSMRCVAAYLYSAAGAGESTTDLAWDGQAMIHENGRLLVEAERFAAEPALVMADLDLESLSAERRRLNSWGDAAARAARPYRRIGFTLAPESGADLGFHRDVPRYPFVPDDEARLDELCFEAFGIQAHGLQQRLRASGVKRLVIGISGGLDSTQALLVACRAFDALGRPRSDILAYTLPAYATSDQTKSNAWALMRALGVTAEEIDLTPACRQMLEDIGHPAATGAPVYDIAFENVQAGARTSLLFRLANAKGALVLGTGDLSELALGWCTYGVGDQMSHYNVNASVPKTLIQHLMRWCVAGDRFGAAASEVLERILATEISPELVPGDGDAPAQRTEEIVGPYALQDFTLHHATKYGLRPSKIAFLAWRAWGDAEAGRWPKGVAGAERRGYDLDEIARWMRVFLKRFFETSQFKRSAMPNGPKLSSGGALSPRGDWRAPSDGSARLWLAELDAALGDLGRDPG